MGDKAVQEVTTPVSEVLAWLARVSPKVAGEVLVGCGFHDGESESMEATVIEAVDAGRATVTLAGSDRPVSLRRFRDGEFVDTRPGGPLAAAVAASRSPAELTDKAEQLALRRAGFDPGKLASSEARRAVLAMPVLDAAGELPDARQRGAFYDAVRAGGDAGTARTAARLLGRVFLRFEALGAVPEDLHWRMAVLLRQAGQLQAAIAASDVLYTRSGLREDTRRYLASTRAGSLLDLAEAQATPSVLVEAERALRTAWALAPGDGSLRAMWRTLNRLREGIGQIE